MPAAANTGFDPLGAEVLPLLLGVPHLDVAQPAVALDDDVRDEARGLLVADLRCDPPVQLLVGGNVVLQRVGHRSPFSC